MSTKEQPTSNCKVQDAEPSSWDWAVILLLSHHALRRTPVKEKDRVPLSLWPKFHIKEMFWYFKMQLNEKWIEDRCTPWGPLLKPRLLAPVEVRAKPLESLGRFNKRTLGHLYHLFRRCKFLLVIYRSSRTERALLWRLLCFKFCRQMRAQWSSTIWYVNVQDALRSLRH